MNETDQLLFQLDNYEGDSPKSSSSNPYGKSGYAAGMTAARGGSASDVASAGLISSRNPYAMGAGIGLQVLSMRQKRKQKEQEIDAKMKLDRISRQQKAMSNLMQLSQGLGI